MGKARYLSPLRRCVNGFERCRSIIAYFAGTRLGRIMDKGIHEARELMQALKSREGLAGLCMLLSSWVVSIVGGFLVLGIDSSTDDPRLLIGLFVVISVAVGVFNGFGGNRLGRKLIFHILDKEE